MSIDLKRKFFVATIESILMYGCEAWTLRSQMQWRRHLMAHTKECWEKQDTVSDIRNLVYTASHPLGAPTWGTTKNNIYRAVARYGGKLWILTEQVKRKKNLHSCQFSICSNCKSCTHKICPFSIGHCFLFLLQWPSALTYEVAYLHVTILSWILKVLNGCLRPPSGRQDIRYFVFNVLRH